MKASQGLGAIQVGRRFIMVKRVPDAHPNEPLGFSLYDPLNSQVVKASMDDGTIDEALMMEPLESLRTASNLNDFLMRSASFKTLATIALGLKGEEAQGQPRSESGPVLRSRENLMEPEGKSSDDAPAAADRLCTSKSGRASTPTGELLYRLEDLHLRGHGACTALLRREVSAPEQLTAVLYGTRSATLRAFAVAPPAAASPAVEEASPAWLRALLESTLDEALPEGWDHEGLSAKQAADFKAAGNAAFAERRFGEAQQAYERALALSPHHLIFRLNKAAALLEQDSAEECIRECQAVISQARALQGSRAGRRGGGPAVMEAAAAATDPSASPRPASADGSSAEPSLTDGKPVDVVVAKAYARMGSAYRKLGKHTRAVNAFLLSLKERADPQVRVSLTTTLHQLRTSAASGPAQQQASARVNAAPPDIEDMADRHVLLGYQDSFRFSCTRCGECCRSADYIMLGPYDLFTMTRSDAMATLGLPHSTTALHRHDEFKSAFKYTLKDGSPVCYLRPIQNPAGRCHFSFPLYRHGGEHGQLLSLEEVVKRGLRQDEDSAYTPVRPDEYNLTEEEEEEALDRMRRTEDEEGWEGEEEEDGSDSSVEGKEREGGAEEGEEEEEDVEAVVNSYGRQALGCMFGMSHMPTMCSSYPLANEQSWADFWYSRSGGHGAAAEALTQQLEHQLSGTEEQEEGAAAAAAEEGEAGGVRWLSREKFVLVKADGCEGFMHQQQDQPPPQQRGPARERGNQEEDEQAEEERKGRQRRGRGAMGLTDAVDPPDNPEQTVEQFLNSGSQLSSRLGHADWFLHLFNRAAKRMTAISQLPGLDPRVVKRCTAVLVKIWYDFDSLRTASSRPFKSFQRVQRVLESLTDCVLAETDRFARKVAKGGAAQASSGGRRREGGLPQPVGEQQGAEEEEVCVEGGEQQVADYLELLGRLNI